MSVTVEKSIREIARRHILKVIRNQTGIPFAIVRIGLGIRPIRLDGKDEEFTDYVSMLWNKFGSSTIPRKEDLSFLHRAMLGEAQAASKRNLHSRIASLPDGTICYNLSRNSAAYVLIDSNSWRIIPNTEIIQSLTSVDNSIVDLPIFAYNAYQEQQVIPVSGNDTSTIDKLMDLAYVTDKKQRMLAKVYLISSFIPDIPKPILLVSNRLGGEVESKLAELVKRVVDPSYPHSCSFHANMEDLVQYLSQNHMVHFKHISVIPRWIRNELVRAIGGSGFTKKRIYTDDTPYAYSYKTCIALTINSKDCAKDIWKYTLPIELGSIPSEGRMTDLQIEHEFNSIREELLGTIFTVISKVLAHRAGNATSQLPLMADFAQYGEAIAQELGYRKGEFLEAYNEVTNGASPNHSNSEGLDGLLLELVVGRIEWVGTATQLKSELEEISHRLNLDVQIPKPNALSKRINKMKKSGELMSLGLTKSERTVTNTKLIILKKVETQS